MATDKTTGLVDTFIDASKPAATSYKPSEATTPTATAGAATLTTGSANIGSVDSNQTVEGRIQGIIDKNSPLQQAAQTRALEQQNSRGLLNSSMAIGAGQKALYESALPIASQDANTFAGQARANQDARNQFGLANMQQANQTSQFNVGEANTTSKFNVQQQADTARANAAAANQAGQFNAGEANKVLMQERDQQNKVLLQNIDAATRQRLIDTEASYKTLMQASDSASTLYSQVVSAINKIQGDAGLDGPAKTRAIEQQTQLLENGLNLLGSINNLNLAGLLNFADVNVPPAGNAGAPAPPPPPPPPVDENLGGA